MKNYIKIGYVQTTLGFFSNEQTIKFYYSKNKKLCLNKIFIKNCIVKSYGGWKNTPKIYISKQKKTYCEIYIKQNPFFSFFNFMGNVYIEIWGK